MSNIQVPAKLFLAMARVFKHSLPMPEQQTPEERQMWLECHRLESRAQSKVGKKQ